MQTIPCLHCGISHPAETKFCPNTGKAMGHTCRRCQTLNAAESRYCSECGVEIARASFGLPAKAVEEWVAKFARDGWRRELLPEDLSLMDEFEPPFDRQREMVIFRERVATDAWTIGVSAREFAVEPKVFSDRGGAIIATNHELIILDFAYEEVYSFSYEHLSSAVVAKQNAGDFPIFTVGFDDGDTIEWNRKQMLKPYKGRGFISRLVTPADANLMLDISELMAAGRTGEALAFERRQNALLVDFFLYIIAEKQRI